MKVGVIGTGYVGLVTGTGLAEFGHDVTCVDVVPEKVELMRQGIPPIHEEGLEDMMKRNIEKGRLHFTTKLAEVLGSSAIFLALPTPQGDDERADLSYIYGVADDLGELFNDHDGYTVVINKSTVPVGTARAVHKRISAKADPSKFDVVSNPEFLREGRAIKDFMYPGRIVIGVDNPRAEQVMKNIYAATVRKNSESGLQIVKPESAEIIKYGANAFVATKISFINDVAELCEATGADIEEVRIGMGTDERIGLDYLRPGPGWGGSCFPKDTRAFYQTGLDYGVELGIVKATIEANEKHKLAITRKISEYFDDKINGKTFALLGLAFKKDTDDVRESPSLVIAESLIAKGANVVAYDPQATDNAKKVLKSDKVSYAGDMYTAMNNADALVIATEWEEFFGLDLDEVKARLKAPLIFDGRNIFDTPAQRSEVYDAQIYYANFGQEVINPHAA